PEILKITLKGSDPDEVRVVLNAVRESYVREIVNRDRTDRESHLHQLTDLASKQEAALAAKRQQLTVRAETLGARDLPALRVKYEHALLQTNASKTERPY